MSSFMSASQNITGVGEEGARLHNPTLETTLGDTGLPLPLPM